MRWSVLVVLGSLVALGIALARDQGEMASPDPSGDECEAAAPARCWYVSAEAAAGGDGGERKPFRMIQGAAAQAGAGDFIYLQGTFTTDHCVRATGRNGCAVLTRSQDGEPQAPIVLTVWPGRDALIKGDFEEQTNLALMVTSSYWVVRGLTIETGSIVINPGLLGVVVEENHVSKAVAPAGNFGLIRVLGGTSPTHDSIIIRNNHVSDLYGCGSDLRGCTAGTQTPWNAYVDIHHAGIKIQGSNSYILIDGNVIERVVFLVSVKRPQGYGPYLWVNNQGRQAQGLGTCNGVNQVFEANLWEAVGSRGGNSCQSRRGKRVRQSPRPPRPRGSDR